MRISYAKLRRLIGLLICLCGPVEHQFSAMLNDIKYKRHVMDVKLRIIFSKLFYKDVLNMKLTFMSLWLILKTKANFLSPFLEIENSGEGLDR